MSLLVASMSLLAFLTSCLLLTQPMHSFVLHNVSAPVTTEAPQTMDSIPLSPFTSSNSSFAFVYKLRDGELITKLKHNDIIAIETQANQLDMIQIIKGDRVIQLLIKNGHISDCEYTSDPHKIRNVHFEFYKVNPNSKRDTKSFKILQHIQNLTSSSLPKELERLTQYEEYEQQCHELHERIRSVYSSSNDTTSGTKSGRSKRYGILVYPGTRWCGKGSNSKNFEDLGENAHADRCCRDHDRCKYSIGPKEKKYRLKNELFYYVSHCICDEKFRTCLKLANSGPSNMIGKAYFNIARTKCFMFQQAEVCTKSTWWGTCEKSKRSRRAVLRDPLEY